MKEPTMNECIEALRTGSPPPPKTFTEYINALSMGSDRIIP